MQKNPKSNHIIFYSLLFTAVLCLFFTTLVIAETSSDLNSPVAAVINADNQQRTISRNGLSAIFKMRLLQWNDGTPVTVFVLADDDPLHRQFCKQVLHVFPHQMQRIWYKAVFSGSGQTPVTLKSVEEMKKKIATTPGAIGYLRVKDIDDALKKLNIR